MTNNFSRIPVTLTENTYDICIGHDLFCAAADDLSILLRKKQVVIVTDVNIAPIHLQVTEKALAKFASQIVSFVLPPGESSKSFCIYEQLINDILKLPIDRQTVLVALGGGVIGDLVGFTAASLLRGLDFIQIPTSLLAQVDSSLGGKTGINTTAGKNLVGAFHQPRLVLADIGMLTSLPQRELKAGYAEIVKYSLLGDAAFFDWLEVNGRDVINGDFEAQAEAVLRSCQAKANIVAADEYETGQRALLNLGHTFAHAFEAVAGYDGRLLHGEAVSVGLVCAFAFSQQLGLCSGQDVERVTAHLRAMNMPTRSDQLSAGWASPQILIEHMRKDKKARQGKLTFILTRQIGEAFIAEDIDENELNRFLETL